MRQCHWAALARLVVFVGASSVLAGQAEAAGPVETAGSLPDWIDAGDWTDRRLIPRDGASSLDNPPVISWGAHPHRLNGAPYTLRLTGPDAALQSVLVDVPRYLPERPLPPGSYRWQVSVPTRTGEVLSAERHFSIDPAVAACSLAPAEVALAALLASERPRMLPKRSAWEALRERWRGELAEDFVYFVDGVGSRLDDPLDERRIESAAQVGDEALAWRYSGRDALRRSARRKLLQLATWDENGLTGEIADDQANRVVYLNLARGFDLLHDELSAGERALVRQAALRRLRQYVVSEVDSGVFDGRPYRSHAAGSLSYAIEALALLTLPPEADDAMEPGAPGAPQRLGAQQMFMRVWSLYRTLYPAWGAQDGSDGNGIGYGWLNLLQPPQTWLVLRQVTGVDFTCRAHMRRAGLQPVYFMPPARPASRSALAGPVPPFGDGADIFGDYLFPATADRELRLYAALIGDPLYTWYAAQARALVPANRVPGFHPRALGLWLMAPPRASAKTTPPAGTPDAIVFEESGAVAMHSALADPARTSVYFLSGRFGNWNHSRAEQNAFVVTMAGESVLTSAGYYEDSPHSRLYTRRTRAANAITFDGGRGQAEYDSGEPVESMQFRGRLVRTELQGEPRFATGDATLAYRSLRRSADGAPGMLSPVLVEALRSVVYWRSAGVIAVFDRLRSDVPRRWEWNVHSLGAFEPQADGSIRARGGEQSLCINMHGNATRFEQTDSFPIEPLLRDGRPKPRQWHGRFVVEEPSRDALFVAVLRERCEPIAYNVVVDAQNSGASIELPSVDPAGLRRAWRLDGDVVPIPPFATPAFASPDSPSP